MKHKLKHNRLNRTPAHRASLMRNLCKALFEYRCIVTTKPKALALISFASRIITRSLKKKCDREMLRFLHANVSGPDKRGLKIMFETCKDLAASEAQTHYFKKKRMHIRQDGAVMMEIKFNNITNSL